MANEWGADIFNGHAIGCNTVSWAPATQPGSLITPQQGNTAGGQPTASSSIKRFACAGCDNLVKIWGYRDDSQSWVEEEILEGHTDWVRDVAWAPNIGLPRSYIATASQDKTVLIPDVFVGQDRARPCVCWSPTDYGRCDRRQVPRCCLAEFGAWARLLNDVTSNFALV